jgi:hypothetical protein
MLFSPGCHCCTGCNHLPDQLYLKSNPYHLAKVPFTYDSGSGLWLCALQATGGGLATVLKSNTCAGSGSFTYYVYQMNAALTIIRQLEACSFNPSTGLPNSLPQNTAPGGLSGSNIFGVSVSNGRGTWSRGTTGSCTEGPLTITASLDSPNAFGLVFDNVTITDVP